MRQLADATRLDGGGLVALTIVVGVTCLLTMLLARLGATGRIAPNPAFGIRTRRTLGSDRAWYHVHRAAAPWLAAAAALLAGGTVAAAFLDSGTAQAVTIVGGCAAYLAVLCAGAARAHRTIPREDTDDRA